MTAHIATDFYFIADRGALKVWMLDKESGRTPRLVENHDLPELHGRFNEVFTDQAGAFPNGGSNGQGNSIAERQSLVTEHEVRAFREIAGQIQSILQANRPRRWFFAAPSEINGAILDGILPDLKKTLVTNLKKDLVNVPTPDLLSHFQNA